MVLYFTPYPDCQTNYCFIQFNSILYFFTFIFPVLKNFFLQNFGLFWTSEISDSQYKNRWRNIKESKSQLLTQTIFLTLKSKYLRFLRFIFSSQISHQFLLFVLGWGAVTLVRMDRQWMTNRVERGRDTWGCTIKLFTAVIYGFS